MSPRTGPAEGSRALLRNTPAPGGRSPYEPPFASDMRVAVVQAVLPAQAAKIFPIPGANGTIAFRNLRRLAEGSPRFNAPVSPGSPAAAEPAISDALTIKNIMRKEFVEVLPRRSILGPRRAGDRPADFAVRCGSLNRSPAHRVLSAYGPEYSRSRRTF